MPLEELTLFVAKAGRNRSPDPESLALAIKKAARESYRIKPELANSVQFILASILKTLSALRASLKEIDKAIALCQGNWTCLCLWNFSLYWKHQTLCLR